ncbi:MAG TPA: 50S ribosomal protein L25 [Dehalococcoidales bacterium]|nr:50S ribosomal protein L25 [Dehalococcoidales bacterium]
MAIELKAAKRHVEGKKVKQLRAKGVTPAHLFGPGVASEAIQASSEDVKKTLAEAGHTRLISLHLGHEKSPRTVMVREIQTDNLQNSILHVDFYQVNLAENIRVEVPIILVGESAAAKAKGNALVQELNQLNIECLPANIPPTVHVDVSPIVTADQMIRVKDIQLGKDISILNDPDVVVARIAVEQIEKAPEKPAAEAEGEAEAAEGAAPAEGKAEGAAEGKKEAAPKAEKK